MTGHPLGPRSSKVAVLAVLVIWLLLPAFSIVQMPTGTNSSTPESCTVFTCAIGDTVLFGNNEDHWLPATDGFIAFVPPQDVPHDWIVPEAEGNFSIHGFVLVGVVQDHNLSSDTLHPQGGMNDQGLCFDINGLPPAPMNGQEGESWVGQFNFINVLFYCSTVEDLIDWWQTHSFDEGEFGCQLHFADATGDAVVVSVDGNGDFAYTRIGDIGNLVSTNFNLANPINRHGGFPCWRYDTATEMLEEITSENELTVGACRDILNAVHFEVPGQTETIYSNIFDPVNLQMHLYYRHDYVKVLKFDLHEEMSKAGLGPDGMLLYSISELHSLPPTTPPATPLPTEPTGPSWLLIGAIIVTIAVIAAVFFLLRSWWS